MSVAVLVLQGLVILTTIVLASVAIGITLRPRRTGVHSGAWPSVDVIVPARDEERRLSATIASLRAQDYPGAFTIWIVDDRSTDATAEIARRASEHDARVRVLHVVEPSRRWAPKVHAVRRGIDAGSADWIATTDADCLHHPGWLRALLGEIDEGVVMVAGQVETARVGEARSLLGRFEALDWWSLMFAAQALTRFGAKVAASANNQAYARSAFRAAGGFGIAARAPSGDEDLLVQRLGALKGSRIVFTTHPEARVLTGSMPDWHAFLNQRRRWVSRFHHAQLYQPLYLAWVVVLGLASVGVAVAALAVAFVGPPLTGVMAAWGALLAVEVVGMHVGLARLGRRDLMGWPVVAWALLHPFVIAVAVLWSLLRPGSWRAGARSYRRRLLRASWRRRRRVWRRLAGVRSGGAWTPWSARRPTDGRVDRW
jgi:cellulose synthase/poly-beta-1,6-N-acetylglucosamine synthase-like glycosyltransferase